MVKYLEFHLCKLHKVFSNLKRKLHENYIAKIIEQSVRKSAHGTGKQRRFRKYLENLLLGDAMSRGETHQWMYDRVSLAYLLKTAGFRSVEVKKYNESSIPKWPVYNLETNSIGKEYKPGSLYVETCK